jgi:hypothetical protein
LASAPSPGSACQKFAMPLKCDSISDVGKDSKAGCGMDIPSNVTGRNIPRFISYDRDLHPLEHHLFIVIAHEIDLETNSVEISIEELAAKAQMSPAKVWRHLPPLEAKGYIEIERKGKNKKDRHIFHIAGPAAPIVLNQAGPSAG